MLDAFIILCPLARSLLTRVYSTKCILWSNQYKIIHREKLLFYLGASRIEIPSQTILSRREIPRANLVALASFLAARSAPDNRLQVACSGVGARARARAHAERTCMPPIAGAFTSRHLAHARDHHRVSHVRAYRRADVYTARRHVQHARGPQAERVCERRWASYVTWTTSGRDVYVHALHAFLDRFLHREAPGGSGEHPKTEHAGSHRSEITSPRFFPLSLSLSPRARRRCAYVWRSPPLLSAPWNGRERNNETFAVRKNNKLRTKYKICQNV